ncbi:hypothetical protein ES332_D11G322500v1 [Gossypium tomentosum]|uniref:PsbP C-terminal domain-containing protein n=1 Tax=Gossypium tomentosum TaxID=34277 RepID=A0A5D2IUB7_GOSTO|nr:hypothetical protein ES332_D11G322500v1 [Gossypium tomentosum]
MALQQYFQACKYVSRNKVYMTQSSNNRQGKSPAEEFAPLATTFRRRLLAGVGSASLVAVGANFGGLTSFLLGLVPESGRSLTLDVLYPIEGYSRRIESNEGFEFTYPASWVGDQRLLYRAAERLERSLDPLPTNSPKSGNRPRKNVNEPIVAYGPPGSSGELNVSVIVSPVPLDFSIETFGGPKEVGEAVVKTITGQRSDVKGTLIESTMREDPKMKVKYYKLEFKVESPSFKRHNVAVCCARGGRLFTLNAQAAESAWPELKSAFYRIANSFNLTS